MLINSIDPLKKMFLNISLNEEEYEYNIFHFHSRSISEPGMREIILDEN